MVVSGTEWYGLVVSDSERKCVGVTVVARFCSSTQASLRLLSSGGDGFSCCARCWTVVRVVCAHLLPPESSWTPRWSVSPMAQSGSCCLACPLPVWGPFGSQGSLSTLWRSAAFLLAIGLVLVMSDGQSYLCVCVRTTRRMLLPSVFRRVS